MAQRALFATLVTATVAGAVVATAATPPLANAAARTTPRALAAVTGVRSCHAHKAGTHWECATAGASCPAEARHAYGYAAKTDTRYRCLYDNGRWRWKAA